MTNTAITDLRIHKSADDYTPQLGQEVTWTITVSNDGVSWAENVRVDDMFPDGMEFVNGHASTGAFSLSDGVWSIGGLNPGEEATATVTMVVTDANTYINNYAIVSTDTHDCNPSNDQNTVALEPWIATRADLSLVKTVSDPKPEVGSVIEWTVTVTNSGPDTAWSTVVNESLPDGLTFVGASASNGTYDFATGTWHVGDLPVGESAEITISTSVDSEVGATFVNSAVASSNTADLDKSNNTAEASIVVAEGQKEMMDDTDKDGDNENGACAVGCCCDCACVTQEVTGADLQIIKLVDNPTPNLNSEVVWTLVVTNNGPEDAVNVIVNDNLPGGVEYVSDMTTMGDFDIAAGVWTVGDLAVGTSAMLQITSVATDAAAVQTNIALVSSDTEDSNPANDVANASIDAVNADLAILKSVDNEAPNLGEEVIWTIDVVNNGPDTAVNVMVEDILPVGTTFVMSSDDRFDVAAGTMALGDMASGDEVSFDITVTVDDADGPRINTATVGSDTYDDNPDNNSDDAVTDAIAADLVIEKSVNNPAPDLGSEVIWTIVVTNNGPDLAENVVVDEALPDGTTFVMSSDDRFDIATSKINLGDMASGESVTVDLTVTVDDADGARVNIASVASDTFDNDTTNNEADAETDAVAADLVIVKSVDNESPDLGAEVIWTIEVINLGPDTAVNVEVEDALPMGTSFVRTTDDRFDAMAGTIALGDIEAGASVSFDVTVTVDDANGPLTNVATVTSDTFDNNPANNIDDATVDAVAADLELIKEVIPTTATLDDVVEWTITVSNQGPDAASGVQVEDILPAGVQYMSDSSGGSVPHITFLGDSWMAAEFLPELPDAIVEPITAYVEAASGGVTTANLSISGHTAAEMLAETAWQPALEATIADTIFLDFGVNEFIAGTTPAAYQADLETLFATLADVSPTSEVVFLIPAETLVDTPVAPWSEYVDAAIAATTAAGVTVINLGDYISAYTAESTLWNDPHHLSGEAASLVSEAVMDGYPIVVANDFDAATGVWNVGELAVGESAELTIEATVVDTGELVNIAQVVASDQVDPDSMVDNDDGDQSEDDEANAVLTVPEIIDLELTQNISITTADVGDTATYTITVTNTSTIPASGVTVSTQLPDHFASGDLTFVAANDDGITADPSSDWVIGDLAPGASITLALDATVNTPGTIVNVAEVETADQVDIDSTPGNGVEGEDDQAVVSVVVSDPNPVPLAEDDSFSVTIEPQLLNAVIMVDHSGSMGTATAGHKDFFDPDFGTDLFDADGSLTSRLQLVRDAVVEFARNEQVSAVKILGFDGEAGGEGNVSPWFDVSGTTPSDIGLVRDFVDDFDASSTTNYRAALEASQDFFVTDVTGAPDPVPNGGPVNYYFLTDGEPLAFLPGGGLGPGPATPNDAEVQAWENFIETGNYEVSYGIGFGTGIDEFDFLDLVSHPNDATAVGEIDGMPHDEENTIFAREANEIPAELLRTVTETVTGNVLGAGDVPGDDGWALGSAALSSVVISGADGDTVFSFDGTTVSVDSGPTPDTLLVRSDSINMPLESGGKLELNFSTGEFEYFAPFTTVELTDTFTYGIADSSGDVATATVDFVVTPTDVSQSSEPEVALFADDDELFASETMGIVQLPEANDQEWAGGGTYYDAELYDMASLVA